MFSDGSELSASCLDIDNNTLEKIKVNTRFIE